ncbi:MAG: hypothetical protein P8O22_01775 [Akkermansiaceae bacterium]|nr:hypothetical protein [Akkermansiaceae bacterium]
MKSNNRRSQLLITTLALCVGLGMLFGGHKIEWVKLFDVAIVRGVDITPNTLHEYDPATQNISAQSLVTNYESAKIFQKVIINDDSERIFENNPPSALDYAVLLESLHNRGYRHANITTRLHWDDNPELLAEGLKLRLALFNSVVIPLAVTRGPNTSALPPMLMRTIIPISQIRGDTRYVPLVNRLAIANHIIGDAENVLAGFYKIESNPPSKGQTAMLARWNDKGIIPSYELLTIMQAHSVLPSQVTIHCGKNIRLGKNGPVIEIDRYGQTTTTNPSKKSIPLPPLQADKVITQQKSSTTDDSIALIHAKGERTEPTNIINLERLNDTLSMTYAHPMLDEGITHQLLPRWAKLVILFDLAIIVYGLSSLSQRYRHLGFALTAAITLPLLYALMNLTQHWIALSSPLAMLLTGWLMTFTNNYKTPVIPEQTIAANPVD